MSGRSRGPAAAFNRACRALLTLASISRRQTERLVSPVDSDPGIIENRRSQQHLLPPVVTWSGTISRQQSRVEVRAVRGPSVFLRTVGRQPRPSNRQPRRDRNLEARSEESAAENSEGSLLRNNAVSSCRSTKTSIIRESSECDERETGKPIAAIRRTEKWGSQCV